MRGSVAWGYCPAPPCEPWWPRKAGAGATRGRMPVGAEEQVPQMRAGEAAGRALAAGRGVLTTVATIRGYEDWPVSARSVVGEGGSCCGVVRVESGSNQ